MTTTTTTVLIGGILDRALATYKSKTKEDVRPYASLTDEELISLVQ